MDFQDKMKCQYNEHTSKQYRESDELVIQYGSRVHYCSLLTEISSSFDRRISVLDLGCGTGRYFHCLKNVERLVGVDISPDMLDQAANPIKKEEMNIEIIELICCDIFEISMPDEAFDFVYSIGVLGECSPFNLYILNKLFNLLKPGGKLLFTIVDTLSRMQYSGHELPNFKNRILGKVFPILPPGIRVSLNRKQNTLYMTDKEIENIIRESAFRKYDISRYKHPKTSGWQGIHYDCLLLK